MQAPPFELTPLASFARGHLPAVACIQEATFEPHVWIAMALGRNVQTVASTYGFRERGKSRLPTILANPPLGPKSPWRQKTPEEIKEAIRGLWSSQHIVQS